MFCNNQAVKQCKDDPTIIAACMLQSFYEAAMVPAQSHSVACHYLSLLTTCVPGNHVPCAHLFQYTFVFMWTPAMEARTTVPPAKIPFGLIFASFMVTCNPLSLPENIRWHPKYTMCALTCYSYGPH